MFSAPTSSRFGVHHQQLGDLVLLHSSTASAASGRAGCVRGFGVINASTRMVAQIDALLQRAPQVAVGEDADDLLRHRRRWRSFPCLFATSRASRRKTSAFSATRRNGVAGAHHVAHMGEQAPAEAAARVRARKIVLAESARLHQRNGQRVAQRERCRRAGGGREAERSRLPSPRWRRDGRRLRARASNPDCR